MHNDQLILILTSLIIFSHFLFFFFFGLLWLLLHQWGVLSARCRWEISTTNESERHCDAYLSQSHQDRDRHRTSSRTRPDQDQKILRNLEPDQTRTKNFEVRPGPGPENFEKSRTDSDQDQQNLEILGPNRTRINKI